MPMVRKARCPMCGSAKSTPTTTAYIYCDYCGQLMDLDIEKYREQVPIPSEEHTELTKKLEPKIEAAKAARDRKTLTALYRSIQVLWVRDMAAMFSPRIKDPEFCEQMIDYLTFQHVVSDLSEKLAPYNEKSMAANQGLEFVEKGGHYLIKAETLWPIIDAHREAAAVYIEQLANFEDAVRDPDDTPPAITSQLGYSTYISGWMTMVDDATAKELLRRTGLEAAYEHVEEPELHQIFCGHCGNKQQRPAGARRVLCEGCGKHADVGSLASCHSCGSKVTIGLGKTEAICEHCQAQVRLVPLLS